MPTKPFGPIRTIFSAGYTGLLWGILPFWSVTYAVDTHPFSFIWCVPISLVAALCFKDVSDWYVIYLEYREHVKKDIITYKEIREVCEYAAVMYIFMIGALVVAAETSMKILFLGAPAMVWMLLASYVLLCNASTTLLALYRVLKK